MRQIIIPVITIVILTTGCLEDFREEQDSMYYTPTYSVPIGPLNYRLDEIMSYLSLDSLITDTLEIPPSGADRILVYDDTMFFINPVVGYDTILTFGYDFALLPEDEEYIQSAMLRINYANGLPLYFTHQFYFYDENDVLLDSLYKDGAEWVPSAEVGERGSVISPTTGRTETYFDSTEVQTLFQTTRFDLFLYLQTYREEVDTLWVYSDQMIDIQLAVRTDLLVPIE
jgi:hypothetical protein